MVGDVNVFWLASIRSLEPQALQKAAPSCTGLPHFEQNRDRMPLYCWCSSDVSIRALVTIAGARSMRTAIVMNTNPIIMTIVPIASSASAPRLREGGAVSRL
jgi:hypothetical protein